MCKTKADIKREPRGYGILGTLDRLLGGGVGDSGVERDLKGFDDVY